MSQPQGKHSPIITLHWLNKSRSQRILWLLEELSIPYMLKPYARDPKTMFAPESLSQVHPMGKSPVITVEQQEKKIVLAESGFICQFLGDHIDDLPITAEGEEGKSRRKSLVPERWIKGQEGKLGGETEEWLRYQYFLHYAEGSLMPVLLVGLIMGRISGPDILFPIRFITRAISSRVSGAFLYPNALKHLDFLESQLATSPGCPLIPSDNATKSGPPSRFLCGPTLTIADILMSFPLLMARERFPDLGNWEGGDMWAKHPLCKEYLEGMEGMESFRRAEAKVAEMEKEG